MNVKSIFQHDPNFPIVQHFSRSFLYSVSRFDWYKKAAHVSSSALPLMSHKPIRRKEKQVISQGSLTGLKARNRINKSVEDPASQ